MRSEKWLLGAIILVGLGAAISQCSNDLGPARSTSPQEPKAEHKSAITRNPETAEDAEIHGLKRQWARADRLCLFDDDELVWARNCAFRSQIERDLKRQGQCQDGDRWDACPLSPA